MKKIALLIFFISLSVQSQIAFKFVTTYTDEQFHDLQPGEFPTNCIINNPLINNNPNLILIITPDWGTTGPYFTGDYSVFFFDNKWNINTTSPGGIPENTKFNVLAVPRGERAFVHTSVANGQNYTVINHRLLNGNPNAKFLLTKASFRNNKEVGIIYVPTINRWTIINLDRSLFAVNSYNIVINDAAFTTTATAPLGNNFAINNPNTDNQQNNLVFTTPIFNGVSNNNPTGVWYFKDHWRIFNQNRASMPTNAKFMALSLTSSGYTNTDNEAHVFLTNLSEILCPKTLVRGDREFDGHGPRIHVEIRLVPRHDTEIWAIIEFTATETVSDFSTTTERFERRVFSSPGNRRITDVLSPDLTTIEFISPSGGMQFIGPNGNSGNTVTITEGLNFIRQIAIVGDTGGADISTDNDCTDDTRIESVSFFPIRIRFAN